MDNARFVLNAANARWGSLIDAISGSNAMLPLPEEGAKATDVARRAQAVAKVHTILDELFPLDGGRWADIGTVAVDDGALRATLTTEWPRHAAVGLRSAAQFVGYSTPTAQSLSVLLRENGLHLELLFSPAGLADVRIESALSTICDLEDSACTVDVADKVSAYRNWLGLMTGRLSYDVSKGGEPAVRRGLNGPRSWASPDGVVGGVTLPGRAVLLARTVGMHMLTDAVTTGADEPLPEHLVDAMVVAACALHDLRSPIARSAAANSRHGSIYVVRPKMHGPAEVQLATEVFDAVESALGLARHTIKMGVMDEERRTSANLAASLRPAAQRLIFVNTGFLDRTADEIHTAMRAGAVPTKARLKQAEWYRKYEENNVQTCVAHGLVGKGQIGKGMWAEPDDMRAMMQTKGSQLAAGASTAWVPSPTAATLHALHYLRTDVNAVQARLTASLEHQFAPGLTPVDALRTAMLHPPVMAANELASLRENADELQLELDDLAQGLLGYVVRWVGQGIGCSKVPSMAGVQLMEDRATLRISSQLIANWRLHGLVSEEQLMSTLVRIATLVDEQNANQPGYRRLAPGYDGPEWYAALELVSCGVHAPNGYTEPSLAKWRRARKALDAQSERAAATTARSPQDELQAPASQATLGDVHAYSEWARSQPM